jgi:hypothetical protein
MAKKQDVNRYVLGTHPRIKVTTVDTAGTIFVPSELRLSVKSPDGTITTYSGGDMVTASGYQYIIYSPQTTGWYQYESWVKDGNGLEDAATNGFEIYDLVYQD